VSRLDGEAQLVGEAELGLSPAICEILSERPMSEVSQTSREGRSTMEDCDSSGNSHPTRSRRFATTDTRTLRHEGPLRSLGIRVADPSAALALAQSLCLEELTEECST
jgi:hypothetical protein